MAKVYWLSRHNLTLAQKQAICDLHGGVVEIVTDSVVFTAFEELVDYIRSHPDGFVYAVAGAPHYIKAAFSGLRFGVFENHPQKRQDGTFGLATVYHVSGGSIRKVWENHNPTNDKATRGEYLLIRVQR